jgi:CBS domain-containing protein
VRASDLIERIPTVTAATTALEAAAVIAEYRLSGLVVADDAGVPVAVVPGTQVLRLIVPEYVREDPTLAHVYDEAGAQELAGRLADRTVGDLLADREVMRDLPSVLPEDTLIEIAEVMVRRHSPVIVVRDKQGVYHGAITFSRTMAAVAAAAGADTKAVQERLANDLVPGEEQDDEQGGA